MSVEKRTANDPPDEPIEPEQSLTLKSILVCLADLSPAELYRLKQAVITEQSERESGKVLVGI